MQLISGKPLVGSHCFLKCKKGYKFAEVGQDIKVGDGWDDQGRLKITCSLLHWTQHGHFDWNPTQWNLFTKNWDTGGNCWKMPEHISHPHACHNFPQCIPDKADL